MDNKFAESLYSGFAKIYIEGNGVLTPIGGYSIEQVTYYIGSDLSNLILFDHRLNVNQMALNVIKENGEGWSPQMFCQPSLINVFREGDKVFIHLYEWTGSNYDNPILWAGVFEGEELQANPVYWIKFSDTGDGRTAFMGLVNSIPACEPTITRLIPA